MAKQKMSIDRKVYNDLGTLLGDMYDRWQEEKATEDFQSYEKIAKKAAEGAGYSFVKLLQRPFKLVILKDQQQISMNVTARGFEITVEPVSQILAKREAGLRGKLKQIKLTQDDGNDSAPGM